MANRPWPEGSTKTFSKCWYEPLSEPAEAMLGLRFTLSHPITAALPPGDENLFRMALQLAAKFTPLSPSEAETLKQKALKSEPIFKYPQQGVNAWCETCAWLNPYAFPIELVDTIDPGGGRMINLELSKEEQQTLITVLEESISDLRREIVHTERMDFKEELKRKKTTLSWRG
jgi:hypothetical protein